MCYVLGRNLLANPLIQLGEAINNLILKMFAIWKYAAGKEHQFSSVLEFPQPYPTRLLHRSITKPIASD
jgi:hypothetical protein